VINDNFIPSITNKKYLIGCLPCSVFLFCFFVGLNPLRSQNLIPNPSFEEYQDFQCRFENSFLQETVAEWYQPINTSTDYWNSQAPEGCSLKATAEIALPRTGNAMVGLITGYILRGNNLEYKEYLGVKLKQKLTKGKFYQVSFYARALTENIASQSRADIMLSNNLAVAFTEDKVEETFTNRELDHLSFTPEVKEIEIIDGSWTKIEYCFLADDDYEFMYIGNFDSFESTTYDFISYNNLVVGLAYYFIDDVFLEELPYDVSVLKKDISYCYDQEEVELNAFTEGAISYLWENGLVTPGFSIDKQEDQHVSVDITFKECVYTHDFQVNYFPELKFGNDTTLCNGERLILDPEYFRKDYQWSDGSGDVYKTITTSGNYKVSIPASGCTIEDEIEVNFIDCPGFIPNVITPNGDEKNEFFFVENIENQIWSLRIYDRWGGGVYFSPEYRNDWSGGALTDGVYYFRLRCDSLDKTIVGWVHVIR
jgi:gliding motility-associated-like protein